MPIQKKIIASDINGPLIKRITKTSDIKFKTPFSDKTKMFSLRTHVMFSRPNIKNCQNF